MYGRVIPAMTSGAVRSASARLIGRRMAQEEFERLRAANDNRRAGGDETDKD